MDVQSDTAVLSTVSVHGPTGLWMTAVNNHCRCQHLVLSPYHVTGSATQNSPDSSTSVAILARHESPRLCGDFSRGMIMQNWHEAKLQDGSSIMNGMQKLVSVCWTALCQQTWSETQQGCSNFDVLRPLDGWWMNSNATYMVRTEKPNNLQLNYL